MKKKQLIDINARKIEKLGLLNNDLNSLAKKCFIINTLEPNENKFSK